MTQIFNNIGKIAIYVTIGLIVIALNVVLFNTNNKENNSRDNDNVADSLTTIIGSATDSINKLDSLRNVYINEAHTLSDSDAINLFYDLLSR